MAASNQTSLFLMALTAALMFCADARQMTKCEVARELLKYGVPKNMISTFTCIAQFESNYDTSKTNKDSGDHGLLQISQLFWCNAEGGPGKACKATCAQFRDDNLADDVACALKIHAEHQRLKGNGFLAWTVYQPRCAGDTSEYTNGCF